MEHPFGGSWGYQVTGYFAPTSRFGTPDDFRYFVDHLHQRGIGVIVDWVPAHFPKDDWALARFDGTALYEHADPRKGEHPDWGTLVFNYGRHEVRNFLIANALYWIAGVPHRRAAGRRRGVDALPRLLPPAAGSGCPTSTAAARTSRPSSFIRQLNTVGVRRAPGRGDDRRGVDVVAGGQPPRRTTAGSASATSGTWAGCTTRSATSPTIRCTAAGTTATSPSACCTPTASGFVLPLSHDEVVHGKGSLLNKMPGDEWRRFANLRALYGWMWAYPGDPMLFMGGEIAQWGEWSETKGVDWAALDGERHRGVQELVRALNRVAGEWPALWQQDHVPWGFQWLDADDAEHSMYSFLRWSADGRRGGGLRGQHDAGAAARATASACRGPGEWQVLLDTNATYFGGTGQGGARAAWAGDDEPHQGQPASAFLTIPPLGRGLAGLPRLVVTDVPSGRAVGHRQPARLGVRRRPGRRRRSACWRWPTGSPSPRPAPCRCWCSPAPRSSPPSGCWRRAAPGPPRWPAACSWRPATACTGWRWRRCCRARSAAACWPPTSSSTSRRRWPPRSPTRRSSAGVLALRAVDLRVLEPRHPRRRGVRRRHQRPGRARARRRVPGRLRRAARSPPAHPAAGRPRCSRR